MSFSLLHPRDQIVVTMERIYGRQMTTTSGGNISVRDEDGNIWITPARVDKGSLRREDVVRVGADGEVEGLHPASSEYPFHRGIYDSREDVRAIIHAHPGGLVSFSICGLRPNTRVFPEAWNVCGNVGFAPYALPGSKHLGDKISAEFASAARPSCVIMENHGVVVAGNSLSTAFQRFETLEFTAQTIINARLLGEVSYLSDQQVQLSRMARNMLPECDATPPSSREKELRKEICDFIHRAYRHQLVTSTEGSFSARIDERSFVITPTLMDRQSLGLGDLVVVRDGQRARGQLPSRAVRLHGALYQMHPGIHAVFNALPAHAAAFCVSEFPLDTRTIPESYLFLKDTHVLGFEDQFGAGEELAALVSPASPIALLRHNGALVAGRTVLDAFDRMEVLESTAAAIIRGRALGAIRPMSDEVIQELVEAFPGL